MNNIFTRFPGDHCPRIPVYSTLTGGPFREAFTADYYWMNTRRPVLFTEAITSLLANMPTATLVEIGPHPVLSSYLASLGANSTSILCPMKRIKQPGPYHKTTVFLDSLGRLATLGHNCIDFQALNSVEHIDNIVSLPPYPFVRKEIAYHSDGSRIMASQMSSRNGALNYPGLKVNAQTHPLLAQHITRDEGIMPAAGYLEMVSFLNPWRTSVLT